MNRVNYTRIVERQPELTDLVAGYLAHNAKANQSIPLVTILEKISGSNALSDVVKIIDSKKEKLEQLEGLCKREEDKTYYSAEGFEVPNEKHLNVVLNLASEIGLDIITQIPQLGLVADKREVAQALYQIFVSAKSLPKVLEEKKIREAMSIGRELVSRREYLESKQPLLVKDISFQRVTSALDWMTSVYDAAHKYSEGIWTMPEVDYSNFFDANGIVLMNQFKQVRRIASTNPQEATGDQSNSEIAFSLGVNLKEIEYGFCRSADMLLKPDLYNEWAYALRKISYSVIEYFPTEEKKVLEDFNRLKQRDPQCVDAIGTAYVTLYKMLSPEKREATKAILDK